MKSFISILFLLVLVAVSAFATTAAPVVAAVPAPTLFGWFQANTPVILGVALAVSELLSVIPAFKGNGILDTIIKALHALSDKPNPQ